MSNNKSLLTVTVGDISQSANPRAVTFCPALITGVEKLRDDLSSALYVLESVLKGDAVTAHAIEQLTDNFCDGSYGRPRIEIGLSDESTAAVLALSQLACEWRDKKWNRESLLSIPGLPNDEAHSETDASCCPDRWKLAEAANSRKLTVVFERCDGDTQGVLYARDPDEKPDAEGQSTYWYLGQPNGVHTCEVVERFGHWEMVEFGAPRFPVERAEQVAVEFAQKLSALPGITVTASEGLSEEVKADEVQ